MLSHISLCLEKLGESYNNCLKWLKAYLEKNSKLVVKSIFLKNKQARLIHERKMMKGDAGKFKRELCIKETNVSDRLRLSAWDKDLFVQQLGKYMSKSQANCSLATIEWGVTHEFPLCPHPSAMCSASCSKTQALWLQKKLSRAF